MPVLVGKKKCGLARAVAAGCEFDFDDEVVGRGNAGISGDRRGFYAGKREDAGERLGRVLWQDSHPGVEALG